MAVSTSYDLSKAKLPNEPEPWRTNELAWVIPMQVRSRETRLASRKELNALLETLGVNHPIVLVGHSAGGMFARVFASRYPDRVAGLVLVDPATEDAYENWQSSDSGHFAAFEAFVRENYAPPVGWYGQWHALDRSIEEARRAWPLPPIPVTVITTLTPFPEEWVLADTERINLWSEAHARLAQRIPGADHIVVESADHITILDLPELLSTIHSMLDRTAGSD